MAAIDIGHFVPSNGLRLPLASRIAAVWQAVRERREEKRTLAQLSRYEPRLLRDIGLDPDAAARNDAWDFEVVHGVAVGNRP